MSRVSEILNSKRTIVYDIKNAVLTSFLCKHVLFTSKDLTERNLKKEIIRHVRFTNELLFFEKFLNIPIVTEGSLDIKNPCADEDLPHPHFIYAIHVTDMVNVKSISVKHRIAGEVFRKDVKKNDSIGIPLAYEDDIPEKMFILYPKRISVIPTTPRYDSSGDITIHLEPCCNKKSATANVLLSIGYFNTFNINLINGYMGIESPQNGIPLYFINGKEVSASVHDNTVFTSYMIDYNTKKLVENCVYEDHETKPEKKKTVCAWLKSIFKDLLKN